MRKFRMKNVPIRQLTIGTGRAGPPLMFLNEKPSLFLHPPFAVAAAENYSPRLFAKFRKYDTMDL